MILSLSKLYFNFLYQKLIDKNIIQKNVMLVGSYEEIKKILNDKFDKILVFKCCMITDYEKLNLKLAKMCRLHMCLLIYLEFFSIYRHNKCY